MEVGGCDLVELAHQHGTPLYVYDEATVRQRASEYIASMGDGGQVLYSAKAFASPHFLRVVAEEGLGLDVVSAGELDLALRSGFPVFFSSATTRVAKTLRPHIAPAQRS